MHSPSQSLCVASVVEILRLCLGMWLHGLHSSPLLVYVSLYSGLDGGRDAFASSVETQHSSTLSTLCMVLQLELQRTDRHANMDRFFQSLVHKCVCKNKERPMGQN